MLNPLGNAALCVQNLQRETQTQVLVLGFARLNPMHGIQIANNKTSFYINGLYPRFEIENPVMNMQKNVNPYLDVNLENSEPYS